MAPTATTVSSYNHNSYYYCYDCGYYIPSGYYCTHSYYGSNYNNARNVNNTGHEVVVVNRRHRSNRSPRHTTRYTVTTTRYYV